MAKLDSLIVDLQLNTAELRKGLDEANTKLDGFGKKLNDLAGVVVFEKMAHMAREAVTALVEFTMAGAENADRMGKMAQSAGMTVESFSALNYVAGISLITVEQFATGMTKLNKNIGAAASGSAQQVALFKALGVSITDSSGHVRAADAVFKDLAGVFSKMTDGSSKSALAIEVFGKSGAELIPMLNEGSAGIARLSEEASKLGVVVSTQAAASAQEFNDNLFRLHAAMGGVAQRAAAELTPALSNLTGQLLHTKDGVETLKAVSEVLVTTLKLLVSAAVVVGGAFNVLGTQIGHTASAVVNALSGRWDEAMSDMAATTTDMTAGVMNTIKQLGVVWNATTEEVKKEGKETNNTADAILRNAAAGKTAAEEKKTAFEHLNKLLLDYKAQIAGFGGNDIEKLTAKLDTGELSEQLKKLGKDAAAMRDRLIEAATALHDLQVGKLNVQFNFAEERSAANVQHDNSQRREQFNNIGKTSDQINELNSLGFKDFNDALEQFAKQTKLNASRLNDAEMLKLDGDLEGAQKSLLSADEAGRAAATASKAADAFGELAKSVVEKQHQIASMALSVIGSVGKTGSQVASLIQNAMEGFKAGGIVGGIIAVIASLFAKLESVGKFMDDIFGQFMQAFGQLNGAFSVLFQSLSESLVPVMKGLSMAFGFIGKILLPIFKTMQTLMQPFESIANALLGLLESTGILKIVIIAVTEVFDAISLVISMVLLGIYKVWGFILSAVRWFVNLVGADTTDLDNTMAAHAAAQAVLTDNVNRIIDDMKNPDGGTPNTEHGSAAAPGVVYNANDAIGGLGDSANTAAAALNTFSSSLTNVPSGFKYALNAFNSMQTDGAGGVDGGPLPGAKVITIQVHGSILSDDNLLNLIEQLQGKKKFRKHAVGGGF